MAQRQTGEMTGMCRACRVSTGGFPLLRLYLNLQLNTSKNLQRSLSPNYIWPGSSLRVPYSLIATLKFEFEQIMELGDTTTTRPSDNGEGRRKGR